MKNIKVKEILKVIFLPVIAASLCCLSPLVLVMLGLSSVAFATSLADTFYGDYKWLFRGLGFLFLLISLIYYFRKQKGICTLDQARRRKNEIINFVLLALIASVVVYVIWLYVVVEILGIWYGIW